MSDAEQVKEVRGDTVTAWCWYGTTESNSPLAHPWFRRPKQHSEPHKASAYTYTVSQMSDPNF
jgi:hypothetical protein